jgi:uncharacterized protein YndB with AHSA1/START domain
MSTATLETDYAIRTGEDTVCIQRLLPGPIERLWSYLIDSELRRKWLASGDMPGREGAAFELVWHNDELTEPPGKRPDDFGAEHRMQSTILEMEPPRRLSFTWQGGSDVTFELESRGESVLLTVTHRHLKDRSAMLMVGPGWHAHLDVLAARLRGSEPEPFWEGWGRLRTEYEQRLSD